MEAKKPSITLNFLYNAAYQLLTIFLPLVTAPYISRVLGAENIGIYSYTRAIANYYVIFAMLGMANYGNRSCAIVRDDRKKLSRTFCEIYSVQCFFTVLCILLYTAYVALLVPENKGIYWLWEFYVISALFDISWFFFGIEKFKITVTRNILIKLAGTACIFLFVKNRDDLWKYILIMSGSFLLTQVSLWPFLRRYIDWTKVSPSDCFKHVKPTLVLFIPVIAVSLYNVMDKLMLGMMCNMTQSGYYENAEKILTIPTSLIIALGTVMLPRASYLESNDAGEQGKELMKKSMLFVSFLSCALAFGISAIAPDFVPWFFGKEFSACIMLIILLSPKIVCVSWANVIRTQYLLPHGRDYDYILSVVAGAAVNLVLNFLLIPRVEAVGAVIATVIAEVTVAVLQTLSVRKEIPWKHYLKNGLPFVGIGIIMFVCVRWAGKNTLSTHFKLLLQILMGMLVYVTFSIVYIFKCHNPMFESIIKKLKNRRSQKNGKG